MPSASMHNQLSLPLIGIILAGGQSTRMGQNKALIKFNNTSLLDYMLDLLKSIPVNKTYISGEFEDYDCIPDLIPKLGPIGGIYSVYQHIIKKYNSCRILFIAVDMPQKSSLHLKKLVFNLKEHPATYFNKQPLPLILQVNETTKCLLEQLPNFFNQPVHIFLKTLGAHVLKSNSYNPININTPEDLQKLQLLTE